MDFKHTLTIHEPHINLHLSLHEAHINMTIHTNDHVMSMKLGYHEADIAAGIVML